MTNNMTHEPVTFEPSYFSDVQLNIKSVEKMWTRRAIMHVETLMMQPNIEGDECVWAVCKKEICLTINVSQHDESKIMLPPNNREKKLNFPCGIDKVYLISISIRTIRCSYMSWQLSVYISPFTQALVCS